MKQKLYAIITTAVLLIISGCSSSENSNTDHFSGSEKGAPINQKDRGKYLAYEYKISVDLPQKEVEPAYQKIIDSCVSDTKFNCTILSSTLNTGKYGSSDITLRIQPKGVDSILKIASSEGEITRQSTEAEDLESSITDVEKRLDMLRNYRSNLEALEKKTNQDIESLIKIAQELSQVQSSIEAAETTKNRFQQRINMNIVRISFFTQSYTSFGQPISESLKQFGGNLSEGISNVIMAVAFLLPWLILISFAIYIICVIRRRIKRRS